MVKEKISQNYQRTINSFLVDIPPPPPPPPHPYNIAYRQSEEGSWEGRRKIGKIVTRYFLAANTYQHLNSDIDGLT